MTTVSISNLRLGRRAFWVSSVAVWLLLLALRAALQDVAQADLALAALASVSLALLMSARLHDRGRSSWWLLSFFIPLLGAAWLFWELGCRRSARI